MIARHALHFRGAKMIIKVGIKYYFQGFFIPLIDLLKYTSFKTSLCFSLIIMLSLKPCASFNT